MEEGSPSLFLELSVQVTHPLARRRRVITAVLAAVVVPSFFPATASADDQPASGDTVVGELVQAWPEHDDPVGAAAHADEGPLTWIATRTGDAVRVSTDDLTSELGHPAGDVPVGATVKVVVGDEIPDQSAADQQLEPALDVLSAQVVTAPVEQPPLAAAATDQVTVVMMIPAGGVAEPGRTLAQVEAAVNGPVAAFWATQSAGAVQLTTAPGDDPTWVQATVDCTDPYGLWTQAAAHAQWSPGPGKHLLVYLPRNSAGCAYGLAQVGPSLTYGGKLYVTDVAPSVIAHELGHNFGLRHSSAQQCDRTLELAPCQIASYHDYYDVMGASWDQIGSLSAPQAVRLGFLPSGQQTVISEGAAQTSVALSPYGARTGSRAIKLVAANGVVYWLEYRTATGADAWLGDNTANWVGLEAGVLLRREPTPADATFGDDSSYLLDGTPSSSSGWNADRGVALPVNQQVVVGSGFSVTVDRADASGATVTVRPLSAISAGQTLASRSSLVSTQRGYRATQQSDGNLVLYAPDGRVLWASYRYATAARTVMQGDGNLVTYAGDGRAVWWSGTWSNPGARLVVQDDGNLVIYRADGTAAWWTGMDTPNTLQGGQFLTGQQQLTSANGRYVAISQSDGNLVVYGPGGRVVWASYRYAYGGMLRMQPDGNVVSYGPDNRAVWWTGTWNNPSARLVMQDDGNLVVYRVNGTAAWWTGMDPLR